MELASPLMATYPRPLAAYMVSGTRAGSRIKINKTSNEFYHTVSTSRSAPIFGVQAGLTYRHVVAARRPSATDRGFHGGASWLKDELPFQRTWKITASQDWIACNQHSERKVAVVCWVLSYVDRENVLLTDMDYMGRCFKTCPVRTKVYVYIYAPIRPYVLTRSIHEEVIKWKHFSRYWPFVRGIHRSPVNSPHKGQWPGALIFSFICAWMNGWVSNREAGDFRRHRAHSDVTVMYQNIPEKMTNYFI